MNRAERRRQRKSAVSGHQRSAINEKTSEEILLNTAMQYLANGHTSRAKEVCSGILKNNPSQPDALHLIGLVALNTGNYKAAIKQIARAVQITPTYVEAISNLGLAYRASGRFKEALKCFRRAVKLNAGVAEIHNNLGLTLHDLREYRLAIGAYDDAISIKPENSESYYNKGNSHFQLKEYQLAISNYEAALEINDQNTEVLGNLGVALQEAGRLAEAIKVYQKVIVAKPEDSKTYNNLGTALRDLSDFEGALTSYMKAISIDPIFEEAHLNLGLVYREVGQLENSRDSLKTAVKLNDRFVEAHYQLGNTYTRLQQSQNALKYYKTALEQRPDYVDVYDAVGRLLLELGRFDDAKQNFHKVLDLDPKDEKFGARLLLAHLGEGHAPEQTPLPYMQQYYRQNIDRWDRPSKKYNGHLIIEEAVRSLFRPDRELQIMDLGCGTGSMGEFLRAYAHNLIGIDISKEMIRKAVAKEFYDELAEEDLLSHLSTTSKRYDLIVCAAVLFHFGNLKKSLEGLGNCLEEGGKAIFTLFDYPGPENYVVNSEGWFSHDANYVKKLAETLSLRVLSTNREVHEFKNNGDEIFANTFIVSAEGE